MKNFTIFIKKINNLMKKITLLVCLFFIGITINAQCVNISQYPFGDVSSMNDGSVQEMETCNYAGDYVQITNLIIGNDYEFTGTGGVGNYITITDGSDAVIASGLSPLTVNAINVSTVRLHLSLDNTCATDSNCHTTTIQCVSATCVPPPPPVNDECAAAVSLTVDSTFCDGTNTNGTNEGATDSGVAAAACFSNGQNDVWFSFTAPSGIATVDVSTDFTGGTLVDTEVALYSGACGTLTELDCDQDGGTTVLSNGFSWNSLISDTPVNAGETYYVRVSGYDATSVGTFCLKISTNQVLSTQDFNSNEFKAYPNPVKNVLNLSYTSEISSASVYNMLGQEVLSKQLNAAQSQLDMSSLTPGSYIVKVNFDGITKTIKVLKD